MFCTCSRSCSISTFMSTAMLVSSSVADFEPSVLASRCSSWIRKSSRLPISPPAVEQAVDLVEVRAQAGQLLGHVDAQRERGGLAQRALARRVGVARRRPLAQRFVPAFDETLLLALHQSRDQRLGLLGQRAQLLHAFAQHFDQTCAFARRAPRAKP